MYHNCLIYLSAVEHLSCFRVLAIINSAVMNTGVHVSLSILVSLVCMPSSGIAQLCLSLWDPIDGSPPGSTVPGILQARTLEWVAIFLL